jgi:hypothetical protein
MFKKGNFFEITVDECLREKWMIDICKKINGENMNWDSLGSRIGVTYDIGSVPINFIAEIEKEVLLKIILKKVGQTCIFYKVLEQDNNATFKFNYKGMDISSHCYPSIDRSGIRLRGSHSRKDNIESVVVFDNKIQRNNYYDRYISCLEEFATHVLEPSDVGDYTYNNFDVSIKPVGDEFVYIKVKSDDMEQFKDTWVSDGLFSINQPNKTLSETNLHFFDSDEIVIFTGNTSRSRRMYMSSYIQLFNQLNRKISKKQDKSYSIDVKGDCITIYK